MSYGIDSKKLKKFIDYYSPFNNGEQLKFLTLFKGEQGLLRYLQTSPFQGIDSTSVQQRKAWFGSNSLTQFKEKSGLITKLLLNPFKSIQMKMYLFFSLVLILRTIISSRQPQKYLLASSMLSLLVLLCTYLILLVPEAYRFYQNMKIKSYVFESSKVLVWRDNQKIQINSFDLVVGDIVELKPGEIICADGLIIEGQITVKQPLSYKLMTTLKSKTKYCLRKWIQYEEKENEESCSEKQGLNPSPVILAGSEVSKGEGRYVVICVGKYSRIGYFISEINRLSIQRPSLLQSKVQKIIFEISKYIVLSFVFFVILYMAKVSVFIILEKSVLGQNWRKILSDLLNGLEIFLIGSPITHTIGLFLGGIFIRYDIYKSDNIWFKYVKDCGAMKDISCLIFDKFEQLQKIKLVQIWNEDFEQILKNHEEGQSVLQRYHPKGKNPDYEQMLIQSLKCQDISPHEVGLKIPSFFIGSNKRFITYIEIALQEYANQKILSSLMEQKIVYSNADIQNSGLTEYQHFSTSSANQKQIQNIYIKGHSETLLKQCTHMMNKYTGQVVLLSSSMRHQIFQIICKMNSIQQPSLITGFIEVNPNHPKFRQTDYRIVMLSLIAYKEKHDNQEFQSLGKIKSMGVTITLIGNRGHQQTLAMGKELGLVIMDKPSVQLKGYGFNKIVGGIICKNCKKSCCVCLNIEKYEPILKNQDQFNRTYKHLHIVSEVNGIEKLTLTIGYSSANQRALFIGKNIHDVPAMKTSSLAAVYKFEVEDKYANYAADLILPNNKLFTIQKVIEWSYHYYYFYRRFLVFLLTSLLVAFISSALSFLLYNTIVINAIQYLWVSVVIMPITGLGFTFLPELLQNIEKKDRNEPLLDKVSYRQISSQVITQTIIIFIILITGHNFIPQDYDSVDSLIEPDWAAKYSDSEKTKICSGINDNIFNNREQIYEKTFNLYGVHSRHLTFIFNLYTLMQLINYLNCFHLSNSRNLRANNNTNQIFDKRKIAIVISSFLALGGQIMMVTFGDRGLSLYPNGLTIKQWAICLGLSLFVIITKLIVKQFPQQSQNDKQIGRSWVNRSYNLSVMAPKAKQNLQDFEMDEELEIKKMAMIND